MTDHDLARGYARAHVADAALWPLLERLADAAEAAYVIRDQRTEARAEVERYRRREADIIEACERVADGGQYRADIVSAIQRIRDERDKARAEIARLRAELDRLRVPEVNGTPYDEG